EGAGERIARLLLSDDAAVRPAARAAALVLATGQYRRTGEALPLPNGDLDLSQVLARLVPDDYAAADEQKALERLLPDLELAAIRAARASTDGARAVAEALSSEGGRLPFAALLVESGEDPEMRRRAEAVAQRIAAKLVPAFL